MSAPEDGRVEDGVLTTCGVCGLERYMYDADKGICEHCAGLWKWAKAYTIRSGDVCMLDGSAVLIIAEESLGKGVMLHGNDGREYPRRNLTGVLVRVA